MIPDDPIDVGDDIVGAVDWNLVGVWFTGLATLLGAIGTVTAVFVALRQAKQAREVAMKSQAASDQLRREAQEEKRVDQARRVFAWLILDPRTGYAQGIGIGNSSTEPVYAVVVHYVYMDGHEPGSGEETEWRTAQEVRQMQLGPPVMRQAIEQAAVPPIRQFRAVIQTLPPGNFWVAKPQQMDNPGLEIAFTDGAGLHWVRRVTGALEERDANAVDFHGIAAPVVYDLLNTYPPNAPSLSIQLPPTNPPPSTAPPSGGT